MDASGILEQAGRAIDVRRVFGEPIERDGVIVVPAARVTGGAGGGDGQGPQPDGGSQPGGGGGGYGVRGWPVGAFVIKDGDVRWVPAFDLSRAILGGQVVALAALWTVRTIARARAVARVARAQRN